MNMKASVCVCVCMHVCLCACVRETDLNSQGDGVEQDEDKHDVFKARGVDDGPEPVLNRILWDVEFEWLSLECVLHTLTLHAHTYTHT